MNQALADAAIAGVTDPSIEQGKGFCSRFVRQVTAKVYGAKYNGLFGASAIATCDNFLAAGLAQPTAAGLPTVSGDILFKRQGAGPFGHVAIFVGDRGVAENSSTPLGRVQGAKGFRTPAQFGAFDFIGRLPAPEVASDFFTLVLNHQNVAVMPVKDGHALCPVRKWAEALGFEVDFNDATQHVILNGAELNAPVVMIDDSAYVQILTLVAFSGLQDVVDENKRIVTVSR